MARFYEGRVAPDQRLRAGRWAAEGGWSPVYDSSMDGHLAAHDLALDRLETGSLTECTRGALLAAIRADAFADGRLPPEAELAEQLGVSRATLRAALQSLEADGLISRRRRHGTYINGHLLRTSMRLNRLVPFTELIELCGHEPSVDVQRHRVEPARGEDAAALCARPPRWTGPRRSPPMEAGPATSHHAEIMGDSPGPPRIRSPEHRRDR